MNESILTWNVTNWVTIILMAGAGFVLFGLAAQMFHNARGTTSQKMAA